MEENKKRNRLNKVLMVLCSVALLGMSACDNDDDNNVEPIEVAYVSLYNASPDAPDLDVVVDNRLINVYPLDYTDYTGYLRFYTGERNIQFRPYAASNVIIDTVFNLEPSHAYSIFVADSYQDANALLLEDNSDAPAEGNAKVRFINLSPDAPDMNLISNDGSDPVFSDISFMEPTDFKEVEAQDYDFMVKSTDGSSTLLSVPDVNLQPGWYYTFLVRGYQSPPTGSQSVLSSEIIVN